MLFIIFVFFVQLLCYLCLLSHVDSCLRQQDAGLSHEDNREHPGAGRSTGT